MHKPTVFEFGNVTSPELRKRTHHLAVAKRALEQRHPSDTPSELLTELSKMLAEAEEELARRCDRQAQAEAAIDKAVMDEG